MVSTILLLIYYVQVYAIDPEQQNDTYVALIASAQRSTLIKDFMTIILIV